MKTVYLLVSCFIVLALLLGACAQPTAAPAPTKPAAATSAPATAATIAPPPGGPSAAATKPAAAASPAATAAAPAVKIKRGGTAKAAKGSEWAPNLDPHQFTGNTMGIDVIFDTLLEGSRDAKTGKWVIGPMIAESWTTPDPKTVIFKIRKGVVFHDGSTLDAKVVKWNIERMKTHPKSAAKTDFEAIEKVEATDDFTIKLSLKAAPAGLLGRLSDMGSGRRSSLISQAAADKMGDEAIARSPVGSGPFTFVEWLTGDHMTVKKFDKYWEKGADGQPIPYLDSIIYRVIIDPTVKLLELRAGSLDLIDEIQAKDLTPTKNDPNLDLVEYEWSQVIQYIMFNMDKEPWGKNLKLRQAALYAIDHKSMASTVGLAAGRPAYYFWDSSVMGYDESLPKYDYQPDKAKALLKEAGYPNGISGTATYFTQGAIPRTAEVTKQMWDTVGIKTTLEVLERTAAVAKFQSGGYEIGLSQRTSSVVDPDDDSYRVVTGGVFNFPHWSSKAMDDCMTEGASLVDDTKRTEVYKRCIKIIYDEAAYGQSWMMPRNVVASKKLKGWEVMRFLEAKMGRAWLDK
jgi:peptide/nickel transport system substrate-binding protein